MSYLSFDEALRVSDAFLMTMYGTDLYTKWKQVKVRMSFTSERQFVTWILGLLSRWLPELLADDVDGPAEDVVRVIGGLTPSVGEASDLMGQMVTVVDSIETPQATDGPTTSISEIEVGGCSDDITVRDVTQPHQRGHGVSAAERVTTEEVTPMGLDIRDNSSKVGEIGGITIDIGKVGEFSRDISKVSVVNSVSSGGGVGKQIIGEVSQRVSESGASILMVPGEMKVDPSLAGMTMQQGIPSSQPAAAGEGRYKCKSPGCTAHPFTNFSLYKRHLWDVHGSHPSPRRVVPASLYKCDQCEYETPLRSNMSKHLLTHPSSAKDPARLYKCGECAGTFRNVSNLRRHMWSIHMGQSRVHSCNLCGYSGAKQPADLHKHMVRRHGLRTTHQCPQCDRYLYSAALLNQHLESHLNRRGKEVVRAGGNTSMSDVNTPGGNVNTSVGDVNTSVGNVNTSVGNVNTSVGDVNAVLSVTGGSKSSRVTALQQTVMNGRVTVRIVNSWDTT